MSNLPPKPDFQVEYSPSSSDHRRTSSMVHTGARRSSPPRDRYPPRSPRYARPPPPRGGDSYIAGGRDSYRGRDYDSRRDRERVPPPSDRFRRDESWEPGERRERERSVEPRRRWEEDDRRGGGYRRDPTRAAGDTRPWPRPGAGGRLGRGGDRSRYDRGAEFDHRRPPRSSRSPPRRFERSPSSRARSPGPPRRRSASPRPPRAPRSRSPRSRSPVREPPGSAAKRAKSPEDEEPEPGSIDETSPPRKRLRSRSRSVSVREKTPIALLPSPERLPLDEALQPDETIPATEPQREPSPPPRDLSPPPQSPKVATHVVVEQQDVAVKVDTDMVVDEPQASTSTAPSIQVDILTESLQLGPRQRAPPSGPRNYVKTPTMSQSPQLSPILPSADPSIDTSLPASSPNLRSAAPDTPTVYVPPIDWKLGNEPSKDPSKKEQKKPKAKPALTHEFDIEIARLRSARTRLAIEFSVISRNERRLLHELTISTLDLSMAEQRRVVASAQLDNARAGVLGMDCVHSPPRES